MRRDMQGTRDTRQNARHAGVIGLSRESGTQAYSKPPLPFQQFCGALCCLLLHGPYSVSMRMHVKRLGVRLKLNTTAFSEYAYMMARLCHS